jgi:hypothetical protein
VGHDTLSQDLGHYIGSKDVVVWTNNVTLKYFATQPKLSSKKMRWQDTLALFDADIRHKLRKENVVLNALNRKHQLKVVYVGEMELQKEVLLVNYQNEFAKEVKQNIQKGIKSHFHLQMDYCGRRKIGYVFQKGGLRMCS